MSGRILIVDDVPTNRAMLNAKLSKAYYDVISVDTTDNIIDVVTDKQPDIVLIDVNMPDKDGYAACEELKARAETAHIPVILITAVGSHGARIRGLEAGADDFLSRPFDDLTLFARVRNLMRVKMTFDEMRLRDATTRELGLDAFLQSPPSDQDLSGRVLIAASSPSESYMWKEILSGTMALDVSEADGATSALTEGRNNPPDVFLVQQTMMDGTDGLRVVSSLRANAITRQSAIIFVVRCNDVEAAAEALDLGASDYITAPFDPNELLVRVRSQIRRKRYSDRLRSNVIDGLRMAVIDPLTGLHNRRYAQQHLKTMSDRALAEQSAYSVLMIDLDNFKAVNDRFGHQAGDAILAEFSRRLQENVRGIDLLARLGGEEFCIAMPETDTAQARFVAERLREAIEHTPFLVGGRDKTPVSVTVSIGVATSTPEQNEPEWVSGNADRALYDAKNSGRNKVEVFSAAA